MANTGSSRLPIRAVFKGYIRVLIAIWSNGIVRRILGSG
jgi:hypothetical protein